MHTLQMEFIDRLKTGLSKKSIVTPAQWAEKFRIMGTPYPGPYSFRNYPWTREMHNSKCELNIGQKSAQMGYTEVVLNLTFYKIDIERVSCLYVLPSSHPDAYQFSSARFDVALELSPYIAGMFTSVKNVGHKRAGSASLYLRGSKSRAHLKSVPTAFVVGDELEEFNQKNIPLLNERTSGQLNKQVWFISTPSIPERGINGYFVKSSQEHFFFPCPSCSKLITLQFPENFVCDDKDAHIICNECRSRIPHENKPSIFAPGIWVPWNTTNPEGRGFYINQLYSPTVTPQEIMTSYQASLRDPWAEQEFYNSKLGKAWEPEGASVKESDIYRAIGSHKKGYRPETRLITLGADIGRVIHYEVTAWIVQGDLALGISEACRAQVIDEGEVPDFNDLAYFMDHYGVRMAILDAQPETRKSQEFCHAFPGRAKYCWYTKGCQHRELIEVEDYVKVDRTSWLDCSLGRFRNNTIVLPMDVSANYRRHICSPVRRYYKEKDLTNVVKYESKSDDHLAHARNYSEIALQLIVSAGENHNISIF